MALYLDFECAKTIDVLKVKIRGFRECWIFLTRVWYLDLDFIGTKVSDTPMFPILALSLYFEGVITSVTFRS